MPLSVEDQAKAESMSLEELRAAAIKDAEPGEVDTGADELDNSAEVAEEPEAEQVFRKIIQNEDGSTDVYEGGSWEEVVEKIASAKQAAVSQMKKVQAERRELAAKSTQEADDAAYVSGEQFKQDPVKAAREIAAREAAKIIEQREASAQRNIAAQSRFVNTHQDYIADPNNGNGDRMMAEFRRLFPDATEFSSEGLEKAYLNLKRDGLLVLRSEEADANAEAEAEESARTERAKAETTQTRSPRRSSTISTRASARGTGLAKQEPTEDELYSMPLDKLRALADKQLAEARGES